MTINLANLSQEEMDKVNASLAAAGISYKERYGMPVNASQVEREQPEELRAYFRERLAHYRTLKLSTLPYQPSAK